MDIVKRPCIWIACLLVCITWGQSFAMKPVGFYSGVSGAISTSQAGRSQTLAIFQGKADDYLGASKTRRLNTVGLNAGYAFNVVPTLRMLVGVGAYHTNHNKVDGYITLAQGHTHDLDYQYKVSSQRYMLEGTLLWQPSWLSHWVSPYISAGVGYARNRSHSYKITAVNPSIHPAPYQGFASRSFGHFSHQVGVGASFNLTSQFSILAGFQYVNLGKAKLGRAPMQNTADRLTSRTLTLQGGTVQLLYIFS